MPGNTSIQGYHDLAISVLLFKLCEVCRVRRRLTEFVVCPRGSDPLAPTYRFVEPYQSGQL